MSDPDRGAGLLSRMVRAIVGQHIAPSVDYLAAYEGVVVAQSADGTTVDVRFDDSRLASPSKVKLWTGIPGVTFRIATGARCLVKWVGGDEREPYVAEWRAGATVTELVLNGTMVHGGTSTGSIAVGRVGDACRLTTLGSLVTWMLQVELFINGMVPGSIAPLVSTFVATPGITINAGSTQFKAK